MFDKVKELNKLRKVQGEIKKDLEQVFVSNEKSGMKVVARGDKKIQKIEIDGEEQKDLKDLINDTFKDVDKKVEKQMRGRMGDLGLPGF
ncbi:MAG: YbaB/EbfC family nucleoid-associated protein [Patescibacteria group bacterium]